MTTEIPSIQAPVSTAAMPAVRVLSGGAAAAVVREVADRFAAITGCAIEGTFNAVGQMRDELLAGAACDLIILTQPLIAQLVASGHVAAGSERSLGRVSTGLAVRAGTAHPVLDTEDDVRAALRRARAIFVPDLTKSTAGIHFTRLLGRLGLADEVSAALRPYPNGASAMAALAACEEDAGTLGQGGATLIGCTQVTEINYTPGVELAGVLPPSLALDTDYTLALCTAAAQPAHAQALADLLTGRASEAIRRAGGFVFSPSAEAR